eukprot:3394515-Pyramimonas_sp.AAC.1
MLRNSGAARDSTKGARAVDLDGVSAEPARIWSSARLREDVVGRIVDGVHGVVGDGRDLARGARAGVARVRGTEFDGAPGVVQGRTQTQLHVAGGTVE